MKGYLPWIRINYFTMLSAAGRLTGRPGPDVECKKGWIFSRAGRLVLFNLAERFKIETAEIQTSEKPVKCPFRVKYLMIIAAFSDGRIGVRAIFPKV